MIRFRLLFGQKTTCDRGLLWGLFVLITGLMLFIVLHTRYDLYIPRMKVQCLNWSFGIMDKYQRYNIKTGNVYAFKSKNLVIIKDDEPIAKIVSGQAFDKVEINASEEVLINGELKARGLQMASKLNKERSDFVGKGIIEKNKVFALGSTWTSYDSRYWGTVDENQIFGRLYLIF